jgi:hypothetical protein
LKSILQSCGVASSSDGQTKEVVVVGGYGESDNDLSTVEIFNFDTKKWRSAGRIIKTVNLINNIYFIFYHSVI